MNDTLISQVDLAYLKEFVKEVLTIAANDDEGLLTDVVDVALNAGVILGIEKSEMEYILDNG